jgi:hypothetical protein
VAYIIYLNLFAGGGSQKQGANDSKWRNAGTGPRVFHDFSRELSSLYICILLTLWLWPEDTEDRIQMNDPLLKCEERSQRNVLEGSPCKADNNMIEASNRRDKNIIEARGYIERTLLAILRHILRVNSPAYSVTRVPRVSQSSVKYCYVTKNATGLLETGSTKTTGILWPYETYDEYYTVNF